MAEEKAMTPREREAEALRVIREVIEDKLGCTIEAFIELAANNVAIARIRVSAK
jgi:hypothetical protein